MALKQNQNARVDAERDTIAPVTPPIRVPGGVKQGIDAWHKLHGAKFHANAMAKKKRK